MAEADCALMQDRETLVGVISDTHGLLRPEALAALQGSDLIVHAGDVGSPQVLDGLRTLAPVHVVRGNIDTSPWASALPATEAVRVGPHVLWVLHDISQLDLDPAAGFAAVIYGHSHRVCVERRGGVLYLNPGSAGPRRFTLPVTVARLRVSAATLRPEIVDLHV